MRSKEGTFFLFKKFETVDITTLCKFKVYNMLISYITYTVIFYLERRSVDENYHRRDRREGSKWGLDPLPWG